MTAVPIRDAAYAEVIGTSQYASFTAEGEHPTIEIRRYATKPVSTGTECDVWVTSGMSDSPMHYDDGRALRRELIFYAATGGDYVGALNALARFPFEEKTYLDHGHTVQTFGSFFTPGGAQALVTGGPDAVELPHVLLTIPILLRHRALTQELILEGVAVEFMWVIPVSEAELALKKRSGGQALLALFEQRQLPWLFDPTRKRYVT